MKFSLLSLSTVAALAMMVSPSFALPAPGTNVAKFVDHRVVRIQVRNEADLKLLTANENALSFDYFTHNKNVGGYVDVRISPQNFGKFKGLGLQYSTLIENLQTLIDQESDEDAKLQKVFAAKVAESKNTVSISGVNLPAGSDVYLQADVWFSSYHSFAEHQRWLQTQISSNPGKATAITAGNSSQGRAQNGLKVGTGPNHVVIHGTQHAREWITTMVVEYIITQLLTSTDPRVAAYLQKYTIHIIPVMNPDGFLISQSSNRMHRKNAQSNGGCVGTDTNRNWGFKWNTGGSSANPCADDYMGPRAFSSPEASNIASYLRSLPKVASYLDIHSYSQLWMTPYGYTGTKPATYAYMNNLAQKIARAIAAVHGTQFRTGDIYSTIYPASGNSADYAYSVGVGAPYAVELRDTGRYGFQLPANQIVPSGEETWAGIIALLDGLQV